MMTLDSFQRIFFVGVAGTGMSAIAQWLAGVGKEVAGSDRYFDAAKANDIRDKLARAGISCFPQSGEGITHQTDLIVVSAAIEDTVPDVRKGKELGIPIITRAELLAIVSKSRKTIAIAGTSGKSTTVAMLFDILQKGGLHPSIISGAGLVSLINQGLIGNAWVGEGEWLVIEADESDGSIVHYSPQIGVLLNIDKDHKEIDQLIRLFQTFKSRSEKFIVNRSHPLARELSADWHNDFTLEAVEKAGYCATQFEQEGLHIRFRVEDQLFQINAVGKHNMENSLAAIAVAHQVGVSLSDCAESLRNYQGIYRRHQLLAQLDGIWVIDDYAHNPVKCAVSIAACQPIASKVIAWFQPHGYGPTRFLRNDFVNEIARVLRDQDEIYMSEIFYAGGTTLKDISANDLIEDLRRLGKNAFFVEDRENFVSAIKSSLTGNCVVLLMGARDPSLEHFASQVVSELKSGLQN